MLLKKPADLKAILITGFFVAITLIYKAIVLDRLGQIGPDSDDGMRLVQIRDLLAGQSWFDMTQYRMGPEGGTPMHWSRIADLPILSLILFFDLFLPYEWAEKLAITIWPIMCAFLVLYAVLKSARHLGAGGTKPITCLLLFIALIGYFRFLPGSIDHHNFQLALIAIAIAHAMDPDRKASAYITSAIAMVLSLAIGPEVYFFIAVLCGFFTLQWLFDPVTSRKGTQAMGVAFALTGLAVFIGTVAPQNYTQIHCESFSFLTLLACVTGGGGLALIATTLSGKSIAVRFIALGVLGFICLGIILSQAPQCLANPLEALPEEVQNQWLNKISEAQPLFADKKYLLAKVPFALGPVCLAIFLAARKLYKDRTEFRYGALLALLILCVALCLYQVRFMIFGHIVSLFVLAPWIGHLYTEGKKKDGPNIRYTGALAASIPLFWGVPGALITPTDKNDPSKDDTPEVCVSEAVTDALVSLPPGLFIAISNDTDYLLMKTPHRALSGNYHRNTVGIIDGLKIMHSKPDEALPYLTKHNVDYYFICRGIGNYMGFAKNKPESLTARLIENDPPDYFEKALPDLEDGKVSIYRFKN